MRSRNRITISQTQRLALNMGLVASIQILRTDAAGLTRYLEEQAAENPHLAIDRFPTPSSPGEWLPRWRDAFARAPAGPGQGDAGFGPGAEDVAGAGPSLLSHVVDQIEALRLPSPLRRFAMTLADALEPSGWLGQPLAPLARAAGLTEAEAEAVLAQLQGFEPTGLFARSLAECLRLQAAENGVLDAVMAAILDNLAMLAQGDPARLARHLRQPLAEITRRLGVIRSFDPKPGARFAPMAAPVREPDLIASKAGAGWQIALNKSALPTLRLTKAKGPGRAEARALLRAIEGRNATLLRVGQEVLLRQIAALENGPEALLPLTMTEIAEALELNQSTISRVVAGAAVDTPRGTWWLRSLFSGAAGGEGLSTAALRARLSQIVAEEDKTRPFSDDALVMALSESGMPVARRTVAKYRAMLKIPPAHRRKQRPLRGKATEKVAGGGDLPGGKG